MKVHLILSLVITGLYALPAHADGSPFSSYSACIAANTAQYNACLADVRYQCDGNIWEWACLRGRTALQCEDFRCNCAHAHCAELFGGCALVMFDAFCSSTNLPPVPQPPPSPVPIAVPMHYATPFIVD